MSGTRIAQSESRRAGSEKVQSRNVAPGKASAPVDWGGEHLLPWARPYYDEPLLLSEGKGVWVRDSEGREYLDLFAGILTTSLGHCHPAVTARVEAQMRRLGHTSTLYATGPQIEVARALAELAPGALSRSGFTNSGTEAIETAIATARVHTGRSEIVALRYAYSGRSSLTTSLTGHAPWRPHPSTTAGIVHARAPYVYRSPLGPDATEAEQTDFFIDDLVEVIETTTSRRPAALLVETIQGVGGFLVPPAGYLGRAAEVIRSYGGLFISDEVQTGFGRTGGRWFGIEHSGVEPDIMVMAKGIANGFPVGATMTRDEIASSWEGKSISTFGGNPVCMAAASATLDVMREEDTPARCEVRGAQLRAALERLREEHAWIGDVRGMGLMQAVELVESRASKEPSPALAKALLEAARKEGILVGVGGLHNHVVRMGPSMLISKDEMAQGIERFERACARVASESGTRRTTS